MNLEIIKLTTFVRSLFIQVHFVSALLYLECYYNECLVKQTASLYLKLSLKPAFFKSNKNIVIFGKLSLLFSFISQYLDKILLWKEMKLAFSARFQAKNLCFSSRWKLNKIQAAQTRNIYNAIFKHIHQNI